MGLLVIAGLLFAVVAYPASRFSSKREKVLKFMAPESLSYEAQTQFINWRVAYASALNRAKWCLYSIALTPAIPFFLIWFLICWVGSARKFGEAQKIAHRLGFTDKQALNGTAVISEVGTPTIIS